MTAIFDQKTAATWTSQNTVLAAGQGGWESDTNKLKIGDGVTAWQQLPYHSVPVNALAQMSLPRKVITIAYAATIQPALPATDAVYSVGVLTGNISVQTPSGTPQDEQTIQFLFEQDGTGSRTISFATGTGAYVFGTDVTPSAVPTNPGAKFRMIFAYVQRYNNWQATGIVRGF